MTSPAGKTRHYVVGSKEVDGKQSFKDIDQLAAALTGPSGEH